MRKNPFTLQKIGLKFDKELKEIIMGRRLDVDKDISHEISRARITDVIPEFPEWDILKKKLIIERRKDNLKF